MKAAPSLTKSEWTKISKKLGRTPNDTEKRLLAIMWSEQVSHRSTVKWQKTLPAYGEHVVEHDKHADEGVVDIGDGFLCAFNMVSDNQYLGSTQESLVNGLSANIRYMISKAARPIAQLNSLHVGLPNETESKRLVKLITQRTGDYSRVIGVPVMGGAVVFDNDYHHVPLTNVVSVGIMKKEDYEKYINTDKTNASLFVTGLFRSDAVQQHDKPDNDELIAGISFDDLYQEKLLVEAMTDLLAANLLVSAQSVDEWGIAKAAVDLCLKSRCGCEIQATAINRFYSEQQTSDELFNSAWELTMLAGIVSGREAEAQAIFEKWGLRFILLGKLNQTSELQILQRKNTLIALPNEVLTPGIAQPEYDLQPDNDEKSPASDFSTHNIPEPTDMREVAMFLLRHPNIASKRWIFEQYDTMVGTANMSANFPTDAGVLNLKGTNKALALDIEGNSRYVKADPEVGTAMIVAQAARHIVCSGSTPWAVTACLNFGNPSDKKVYSQFVKAIKGLSRAAQVLGVPVVGGDVSFYHENNDKQQHLAVSPTSVVAMLGVMPNKNHHNTISFKSKGHMIYLLGHITNDISCSEYLHSYHKVNTSPLPYFDLVSEVHIQKGISELIQKNIIASAHDVSAGGLFVTLFKCCLQNSLGFDITTDAEVRTDAFLFGEGQGRVVVSVSQSKETEFLDFIIGNRIPTTTLGHVTKGEMRIDDLSYGFVNDTKQTYLNALSQILEQA